MCSSLKKRQLSTNQEFLTCALDLPHSTYYITAGRGERAEVKIGEREKDKGRNNKKRPEHCQSGEATEAYVFKILWRRTSC